MPTKGPSHTDPTRSELDPQRLCEFLVSYFRVSTSGELNKGSLYRDAVSSVEGSLDRDPVSP